MTELNQNLVDSLPFEPKQQDAIFGYALLERTFMMQIKDRVKSNWFIDSWTGKAYDGLCKFYDRYGHEPKSDDELFLSEEFFVLPPLERTKVKNAIMRARLETQHYSLDVLKGALTGWLKSRIYHQYVSQSATLFNARKFTAAEGILGQAVKELQEVSFEGKPPADWSNPAQLVQTIESISANALTLGHPLMDRLLNPDCKKGSLLPGDSTVLLAPTNIGKTTCKITVAVANLLQGKTVIFITHEGRKVDIQEKIWQCLLKVTKQTFRKMALSDDPNVKSTVLEVAKLLSKNLVYIDYQKPGTTVEEVVSVVRQHQQRQKSMTGAGFDLFMNDYPAILSAEGMANLRSERRHKDAYVYRYLIDYAGEQGMHGFYSAQTNREGSKKNKKSDPDKQNQLVQLEDIQETYEITNSATNLITVNRSPSDQARGIISYLYGKSRSSETNIVITCQSNFACARTHDPELPATWYRGTESLDHLDTLLKEYNNQEIPWNYKDLHNET
jgi:hypothetical protein